MKRISGTEWAINKDVKSGRYYYMNLRTSEISWTKPFDLANPMEKSEILRKKSEMKSFFRIMEQNIKQKLETKEKDTTAFLESPNQYGNRRSGSAPLPLLPDPSDNDIPHQLRPCLSAREFDTRTPAKPKRRNSTGTLYVENTMNQQDMDATIKCVCQLIHSLILQYGAQCNDSNNDDFYDILRNRNSNHSKHYCKMPTLHAIEEFFKLIYTKSQLENECVIVAFIYCQRLIHHSNHRLGPRWNNWKSIIFMCLLLASKVWDDLSMWNVDFSRITEEFSLQRINAIELILLLELQYDIRISSSEYANYYFYIRSRITSMISRSSSSTQQRYDDHRCEPLNLMQARKLQLTSEKLKNSQLSDLSYDNILFNMSTSTTTNTTTTTTAGTNGGGNNDSTSNSSDQSQNLNQSQSQLQPGRRVRSQTTNLSECFPSISHSMDKSLMSGNNERMTLRCSHEPVYIWGKRKVSIEDLIHW